MTKKNNTKEKRLVADSRVNKKKERILNFIILDTGTFTFWHFQPTSPPLYIYTYIQTSESHDSTLQTIS